jgi:hypothetical protein
MSLFILLVLNTGYHREALKSLKACAQSSIWILQGAELIGPTQIPIRFLRQIPS